MCAFVVERRKVDRVRVRGEGVLLVVVFIEYAQEK